MVFDGDVGDRGENRGGLKLRAVHLLFSPHVSRIAISPEQSTFHALYVLYNELSVATGLNVQPHNRFGV